MIHPTAVIHPKAHLDPTVTVGPYAVIDEHVVVGPLCAIGPHVYLTGHTVIGAQNRFHAGSVIGDAPQDLKYRDAETRVRIGDDNVFREHITVHRSNTPAEDTVIGSHNFLMAHSHVGHNAVLGDHVILANGALLGGHVVVEDRAFISGNCVVHQFVRIGSLAMMQGGAALSKDLPPFTVMRDYNRLCGLNIVGLRRAGFTSEQRIEMKQLYHALFRAGAKFRAAVAGARERFQSESARMFLDFVSASTRGLCADVGRCSTPSADPTATDASAD